MEIDDIEKDNLGSSSGENSSGNCHIFAFAFQKKNKKITSFLRLVAGFFFPWMSTCYQNFRKSLPKFGD
jgi:hypothetical protein